MEELDSAVQAPTDEATPEQAAVEALPDLTGEYYQDYLHRLHRELMPKTYLEVGTLHGDTLRFVECASLAIDPQFRISTEAIGRKPVCSFYQMTSDRYFELYNPRVALGGPVGFAFLDGMHHCEFLLRDFMNVERHCERNSLIVLHDCVPVDPPTTSRLDDIERKPPIMPHRGDWWLGDVWRVLLALKRRRLDLSITVLDAPESGLVCITNLDPASTVLADNYASIVQEMRSWDLADIGVANFVQMIDLEPTSSLATGEEIRRRFRPHPETGK